MYNSVKTSKYEKQYMQVYSLICKHMYGDTCTISQSMRGSKDVCYPLGVCIRHGDPGAGSSLFYINTWAMIWPVNYQAKAS